MLLFGTGAAEAEADLAYRDTIDRHSPADLSVVVRSLGDHFPTITFEELIYVLRTTSWDPDYLGRCVQLLLNGIPNAEDRLRRELLDGLERTWANYYPIGETADVPFVIGVLLFALQQYEKALEFFQLSLRDFGEEPQTTVNIAMTLYHLQRLPESLEWLDRTLTLDPTHELATNMRADILTDLSAPST